MTEHWVKMFSNQKDINYISPSTIRASVETGPAWPSYTVYSNSLPLPSLTFYGPSPKLNCKVLRYTYFYLVGYTGLLSGPSLIARPSMHSSEAFQIFPPD